MQMADMLLHPLTLRCLYMIAMGRAFLRFYNPRRRASGKHQDAFYQFTWKGAGEALGATWTPLRDDMGELELDGRRTRVVGNVSEIDGPVTLAVLHDKPLTHRLLAAEGLPVPRHATFTLKDTTAAVRFMRSMTGDCVVKPAGGTGGGRGVTTGIRTHWQLARAAAAAAVYADELMIEEQIAGDNYRLLYLDGKLLDAFVRRLPSVVGDGRSTIKHLVARHNEQRLSRGAGLSQVLLTVDLDMRRTLAKQGLSMHSVPSAGTMVTLKTVVNENCGADNSTVTHLLHRSIVQNGERVAAALRARFIGVDVVMPDPTVPLRESGGVILEVNGTPNLYYHYQKRDGCAAVAVPLLRKLLAVDAAAPDEGTTSPAAEAMVASR